MDTNNINTIQIDEYFKELNFQCNKLSNFLTDLSASSELAALKKTAKRTQKINSALEGTVTPVQADLKKAADEAYRMKQKFNKLEIPVFHEQTNFKKALELTLKYIEPINQAINSLADIDFEPIMANNPYIDELIQNINECFEESSFDDEDTDTPIELSKEDEDKLNITYNNCTFIINNINNCANSTININNHPNPKTQKGLRNRLKVIFSTLVTISTIFSNTVNVSEYITKNPITVEDLKNDVLTSPSSIGIDSASSTVDEENEESNP